MWHYISLYSSSYICAVCNVTSQYPFRTPLHCVPCQPPSITDTSCSTLFLVSDTYQTWEGSRTSCPAPRNTSFYARCKVKNKCHSWLAMGTKPTTDTWTPSSEKKKYRAMVRLSDECIHDTAKQAVDMYLVVLFSFWLHIRGLILVSESWNHVKPLVLIVNLQPET